MKLSIVLRVIVAVILLQTLFFKFTGARESVYIFSTLGIEPWGRIGSGVTELIAAVLLLVPRTVVFGAGLSLGVISVAIASHLTKLGITLPAVGDRGELFALAVTVSVQLVGVYLVFATLIVPALGVRRHPESRRLRLAYAIGVAGYAIGLLLSSALDLPSGALIVWCLALLAIAAHAAAPRDAVKGSGV